MFKSVWTLLLSCEKITLLNVSIFHKEEEEFRQPWPSTITRQSSSIHLQNRISRMKGLGCLKNTVISQSGWRSVNTWKITPQSVITMLSKIPGSSDPLPDLKETLFMLLFLVSGLFQENIGTPVDTRPRTVLGSLVPVLLGDIGLETPYEPSIWTIPPFAPGHLSGDQYRGSATTPHRCLTLLLF